MRIAICEDELFQQKSIKELLQKWAETAHQEIELSVYDSAEELLIVWEDVIFDILILDIEMKKMNGMELAKTIRRINEDVIIIFVTGYASYSLEGYDVNPLHYLVKPLDERMFFKVIDKAYAIYKLKGGENLIVHTGDGLRKIPLDKIYYIAICSHEADVYTVNGKYKMKSRTTMKGLSLILPAYFVTCHRSYIINMFKVNCVFNDHVLMDDSTEIPVNRNQIKQVRELFIRLRTR